MLVQRELAILAGNILGAHQRCHFNYSLAMAWEGSGASVCRLVPGVILIKPALRFQLWR